MNNTLEIKRENGKIYSHIRKKWLVETPEEKVRQELVTVLVNKFGYPLDVMTEEYRTDYEGRGVRSTRADIVIYKSKEDKKKNYNAFIVVECKAETVKIRQEDFYQGTEYAGKLRAQFLILHNSKEKVLYNSIKDKYPIALTRDLNKAKEWVRSQCQGTTRYGLLASSGALRLKPEGIFVKNEISVVNWFLNGKDDVRSSYYLEDVVSEFDIQGLELDYSIVAWDADFRFDGKQWTYNNFVGNRWMNVASEDRKLYLKNAYRVLLTRARQGMVIFIPEGSDTDGTRKREWYDRTYEYLADLGLRGA